MRFKGEKKTATYTCGNKLRGMGVAGKRESHTAHWQSLVPSEPSLLLPMSQAAASSSVIARRRSPTLHPTATSPSQPRGWFTLHVITADDGALIFVAAVGVGGGGGCSHNSTHQGFLPTTQYTICLDILHVCILLMMTTKLYVCVDSSRRSSALTELERWWGWPLATARLMGFVNCEC